MSMLCAISGEVPTHPVASTKSGTVFEKRLVEAHLEQHGTDPVTGEQLSTADLVEIKASSLVRPRPPSFTSIPAMLSVFQNEWDTLALETFELHQQLVQVRQELSTALYQNDAATRVIARLMKERDEAREALSNVTVGSGTHISSVPSGEQMEVDPPQVPSNIQDKIEDTKAKLFSSRKKRSIPEGWSSTDSVSSFTSILTTEPFYPGTKSLALDSTGELALFGGVDGIAGVYSIPQKQLLDPLKAEDGAINDVAWAGKKSITATSSGVVRIWSEDSSESTAISTHAGDVVALAVHPSESLFASAGADKSWVLYDLETTKSVAQVYDKNKFTCAQFHPDGHLLAVGTSSQVKVFDVRSATLGATLGPLAGPVSQMSFSENGYWLGISVQGQNAVEIWDLRKMSQTKALDLGSTVDHVRWDYSGQFLATAGPSGVSVQHYSKTGKLWTEPLRNATPAVATAWGPRASSLVCVNDQGALTVFGTQS